MSEIDPGFFDNLYTKEDLLQDVRAMLGQYEAALRGEGAFYSYDWNFGRLNTDLEERKTIKCVDYFAEEPTGKTRSNEVFMDETTNFVPIPKERLRGEYEKFKEFVESLS